MKINHTCIGYGPNCLYICIKKESWDACVWDWDWERWKEKEVSANCCNRRVEKEREGENKNKEARESLLYNGSSWINFFCGFFDISSYFAIRTWAERAEEGGENQGQLLLCIASINHGWRWLWIEDSGISMSAYVLFAKMSEWVFIFYFMYFCSLRSLQEHILRLWSSRLVQYSVMAAIFYVFLARYELDPWYQAQVRG